MGTTSETIERTSAASPGGNGSAGVFPHQPSPPLTEPGMTAEYFEQQALIEEVKAEAEALDVGDLDLERGERERRREPLG